MFIRYIDINFKDDTIDNLVQKLALDGKITEGNAEFLLQLGTEIKIQTCHQLLLGNKYDTLSGVWLCNEDVPEEIAFTSVDFWREYAPYMCKECRMHYHDKESNSNVSLLIVNGTLKESKTSLDVLYFDNIRKEVSADSADIKYIIAESYCADNIPANIRKNMMPNASRGFFIRLGDKYYECSYLESHISTARHLVP